MMLQSGAVSFVSAAFSCGEQSLTVTSVGMPELESPIRRVEVVNPHVADGARAEVPEAAPFERHVGCVVRPLRCRPEPHLPVEAWRHGLRLRRPQHALRPPSRRTVGPDVQFLHVANQARAKDFHGAPGAFVGVALRAHLRREPGLGGDASHLAHFPDAARQRLLGVDVLAETHGGDRDDGVIVIWRRNEDGVDGLLGIEELPPVRVALCVRQLRERLGRLSFVAVAQRDDVHGAGRQQLADVAGAAATRADHGDVQHVVCLRPAPAKRARAQHETARQRGGTGEEGSTAEVVLSKRSYKWKYTCLRVRQVRRPGAAGRVRVQGAAARCGRRRRAAARCPL